MPDTAPQEQQTGSSASDLAAANERGSAWRNLNDVIRSASAFVPLDLCNELEAACARMDRALSSLGDGDDSARLEGLDAELRKQGASWRSSFRAWGHDFTLFEDGWHVAVDAISDPIIDGADLRSAIDAARTAPGGASND